MSESNINAQTYYEIKRLCFKTSHTTPDYTKNVFTYLKNEFTADVLEPINLIRLEQEIKECKAKTKQGNRCLLKGLYKDGFDGKDCYQSAGFLFFDIDVKNTDKKKENLELFNFNNNVTVFNELKQIAVIVWRSNSGNGIAGVLYVPQLAELLNGKSNLHLQIGKRITSEISRYLHEKTGLKVKFDPAQSKFRQVRYLAPQTEVRELNKAPFVFTYEVEEKIKEIAPSVPAYKFENYRSAYGTITAQFDAQNNIFNIALSNGFTAVGNSTGNRIRVKYYQSESPTSGFIDLSKNILVNFSSSVGEQTVFTPSQLYCKFVHNGNWSEFYKELKAKGYKEQQISEKAVHEAKNNLKADLNTSKNESEVQQAIFKNTYDLQTLSHQEKKQFIKDVSPEPEQVKYFNAYLKIQDYKIEYDKELTINNYVAEQLDNILTYADENRRIILRAETGKGKTTAFVRDFHKLRPDKRILILEPLTIIIDQAKAEYKEQGVFLTGKSTAFDFAKVNESNLVFSTFEQALKLHLPNFDYIIIDEVHNLINANSYKEQTIKDITYRIEQTNSVLIGLTGTPSDLFKQLDFKLLNVDVKHAEKVKINARFSNKNAFAILHNHLKDITGKALFRLNEIKTLESFKADLLEQGYNENEILVLYSTQEIKDGADFKDLASESKFNECIKIVLTTSLIDEGLSIIQNGFTDIVFIETNYTPAAEPIKQFFARFRNEDPNRKNYLYLRSKKDQTQGRLNTSFVFAETLQGLETEAEFYKGETADEHGGIFSNDNFYFDDSTINKYYLAYNTSRVLYGTLNNEQFLEYLTTNFNFEIESKQIDEVETWTISTNVKERKKEIANQWLNNNTELLQAIRKHTQDINIKSSINLQQVRVTPEIDEFTKANIKDLEQLFKYNIRLLKLDCATPDNILIKTESDGVTLNSWQKIKNEIKLLKLNKVIFEPQNKKEESTSKKYFTFIDWIKQRNVFTTSQFRRELSRLRIYDNKNTSFEDVKTLCEWHGIKVKKDFKTGACIVAKI